MAHTEGPWDVDDDTLEIFSITPGHSTGWIAKVLGNDDNGRRLPPDEMAANARLIASAPDLLAVAKLAFDYAQDTKARFIDHWDGEDAESYGKLCDAIDDAIAKAEGSDT
jgi:hypothetical protein